MARSLARCLILVLVSCTAAAPVTLFVATNGNDDNPGTEDQPFRSLAQAQTALRAMSPLPPGGAVVNIRGGAYYVDPANPIPHLTLTLV